MTVTAFLIHGASGQNLSCPASAAVQAEPADVNTWKVRLCQLAGGRLGTEQARLYGWLGLLCLKNLTKKFQEVFQSMDMKNSYPALFQVLWHSVNPCFDIQNWTSTYRDQKSTIKRCKWKGVDVSFSFVEK